MDTFLTWDVLLTYGGCVMGTVLLTEGLKKVFTKINAQIISFVIALAILLIGHLATGTFVPAEVPLHIINAVVVSLAANGGFDAVKRVFGKETVDDEMVIDVEDPEQGGGVYLNLTTNPQDYKDGQVVSFRVKKTSQN